MMFNVGLHVECDTGLCQDFRKSFMGSLNLVVGFNEDCGSHEKCRQIYLSK